MVEASLCNVSRHGVGDRARADARRVYCGVAMCAATVLPVTVSRAYALVLTALMMCFLCVGMLMQRPSLWMQSVVVCLHYGEHADRPGIICR